MPTNALLLLFLASAACAQSVFHFPTSASSQDMQEETTMIRAIGEIKEVTLDTTGRTLSVNGTPTQLAFTTWYFNGAAGDFRFSPAGDDIVRLYHLTNTGSVQELQEVATAVRSTAEIRRLFTATTAKTIAARGTPGQIKLAQWLIQELDRSTGQQSSSHEYQLAADDQDIVRIFFLPAAKTIQDLQELATMVRATAEIRRLFTYNAPRAVIARGDSSQIKLAEWLFSELSKPATASASNEYQLSPNDDVVRVFYLPNIDTVQHFQEIAVEVRKSTAVRRLFTYNAPRAMALRGTSDQIA